MQALTLNRSLFSTTITFEFSFPAFPCNRPRCSSNRRLHYQSFCFTYEIILKLRKLVRERKKWKYEGCHCGIRMSRLSFYFPHFPYTTTQFIESVEWALYTTKMVQFYHASACGRCSTRLGSRFKVCVNIPLPSSHSSSWLLASSTLTYFILLLWWVIQVKASFQQRTFPFSSLPLCLSMDNVPQHGPKRTRKNTTGKMMLY